MIKGPPKRLMSPSQFHRLRTAARLLLVLIAGFAWHSCSVLSPPPIPPALDVTGFWEGNSMGSCVARLPRCGAIEVISLSMIQNESKITGSYRCDTGNIVCRNMDTHGQIAVGQIRGTGVSLRIMFEDVSSCIFNGHFSNDAGGGAYICMQGGGIVERGFWRVKRTYGPSPPPAWWTG
jgi:hypothetical protein